MSKRAFAKVFAKSQIASLIGSGVDFVTMIFFTELLGIYYVISRAIGAAVGAVVNFLINRHWTWRVHDKDLWPQVMKYSITASGSLLLNTIGVWFSTEFIGWDYKLSWLIVSLIVGIGFNFVMHKIYVFK